MVEPKHHIVIEVCKHVFDTCGLNNHNLAHYAKSEDCGIKNTQHQTESSHEGNSIGFNIEQRQTLLALLTHSSTLQSSNIHHLTRLMLHHQVTSI